MENILQAVVVALLVPVCIGYAVWKLMPGAARRAIAGWLLGRGVGPSGWRRRLERVARTSAGGGCGCDGCDAPPAADRRPTQPGTRPIVIHRRAPGPR